MNAARSAAVSPKSTTLAPTSEMDILPLSPALMFEGLLRWLPTALLLVNPDGQVLHLNERATTLLRLNEAGQTFKQVSDFPEHLKPLRDVFAATAQTDQIRQEVTVHFPAQNTVQAPETNVPETRVMGYTLRHEQLPGLGAVRALVFNDITEILKEKAAAEQIRHELFQTKKMAAMGNLITGVAHELNNPLIAIHMSADLSRRSVDRLLEETRSALNRLSPADWQLTVESALSRTLNEMERVQGATHQATALVSDLLDYSRPGRLELEQVDVLYLIETLIAQWRDTILSADGSGRPVQVKIASVSGTPIIALDPVKMEQVLFHVVRNAVEASVPEKPCELSIELNVHRDPSDAANSRLNIVLDDNGVGMSPELMERAFEPFFTTKGRHSTGLGLSQAFVTVERHGGHLALTSRPGQGTRVTISLPYPEAPALPTLQESSP